MEHGRGMEHDRALDPTGDRVPALTRGRLPWSGRPPLVVPALDLCHVTDP
jgi:hypothetical protein